MSRASFEWGDGERNGDGERSGPEATTDEALSSVFATMRTVGRREAERLTADEAELIARTAAGAARSRYRARLGLLAAAAAIVAVMMVAVRPAADEVAVSSAARPGAVPHSTTTALARPSSEPTASPTAPTTAVAAVPAPTATLATTTEPTAEGAAADVVADTAPAGGSVESAPPPTSTTTLATSPQDPSASQPAAQPDIDEMALPVGAAGTVTISIVDNAPVLVEVVPADGWTYAVAEDQMSLVVQFASQGGTATLEIRSGAASFELLIDPGPAGTGGYTRTRTVDLSPAGAVRVVHSGGQLRSIEAAAGAGWTLRSETTGSDRLDLGFVANGNWIPVGYVLTVGTLELVIRAG